MRRFLTALLLLLFGIAVCVCDASDQPAGAGAASETTHAPAKHGGEPPGPITAEKKDVDLALWTLVVFLVLLAVLKKFAWRPLIEGLDKRESRVRQDLADAEAARVKAQELLAEHEDRLAEVHGEVREIIAEARRDAEHTKNEILTHAQHEAETARQRAVEDIERARDDALEDLFNVMADQVVTATTHVLGRSLTAEDQDRLIQEALTEVASEAGAR